MSNCPLLRNKERWCFCIRIKGLYLEIAYLLILKYHSACRDCLLALTIISVILIIDIGHFDRCLNCSIKLCVRFASPMFLYKPIS